MSSPEARTEGAKSHETEVPSLWLRRDSLTDPRATRIAFVGAGNITTQHANSLRAIPSVSLVGVCDVQSQSAKRFGTHFGIPSFKDPARMVEETIPDGVVIGIPPFAHGPAELACVSRGVPFLVEKPISNSLAVAQTIERAVRGSRLITSVGYMNRYRKGVRRAREMLSTRSISVAQGTWATLHRGGPEWLVRESLSGGQLLEQLTHLFDLLRYFCGEVREVRCLESPPLARTNRSNRTRDATVVALRMNNGTLASVVGSRTVLLPKVIQLRLFGPEIKVEFSGWDFHSRICLASQSGATCISGERDIFRTEQMAFLTAIRSGNPSQIESDYSDALKTLRVGLAAKRSARTGHTVVLSRN